MCNKLSALCCHSYRSVLLVADSGSVMFVATSSSQLSCTKTNHRSIRSVLIYQIYSIYAIFYWFKSPLRLCCSFSDVRVCVRTGRVSCGRFTLDNPSWRAALSLHTFPSLVTAAWMWWPSSVYTKLCVCDESLPPCQTAGSVCSWSLPNSNVSLPQHRVSVKIRNKISSH